MKPQAKFMLKDKTAILQNQDTNLFEKFHQHLMETVKVKKQSKEVFIENIPCKHNLTKMRPFRSGSLRESAQDWR